MGREEGKRERKGGGGIEGRKEGWEESYKLTKQQTLFLLHCKGHLSAAIQLQENKCNHD